VLKTLAHCCLSVANGWFMVCGLTIGMNLLICGWVNDMTVGDYVSHRRTSKVNGNVYLTYRGKVVAIEGRLATVRLNGTNRVRFESIRKLERYLHICPNAS
jgi:hypothetical protein